VTHTLFPLRESTLTIRGREVKVRELTQHERDQIARQAKDEGFSPICCFAASGCISPAFNIETAKEMPADVIGIIAKEVMKLSGLSSDDEDKGEAKNA
jgi:hypothetical protein